jgi:hypothetical protein
MRQCFGVVLPDMPINMPIDMPIMNFDVTGRIAVKR